MKAWRNEFYFQIPVSEEQVRYAKTLVEYSLKHHPISNIWDTYKKEKTEELRFTGSLGEVLFADVYNLERPTRSFGAVDGQDFGKDFQIKYIDRSVNYDVKTMHRKTGVFYKNYVLNIPARQLHRPDTQTDNYFCISLHEEKNTPIASFLGFMPKADLLNNKIGILYKKNTVRVRADKTTFRFLNDTYEVDFQDINSPMISKRIRNFPDFKLAYLR